MSQPYGVAPQTGHPPPPAPPRRRRVWPALAVAGALLTTAVVAGALGVHSRSPVQPAASAPSQVSAPSPTDATATLCATVAREYPAIVAAIDERNIYNREPWTNPELIRTSDKMANVASSAAAEIEDSMSDALPASASRAASEYVTALRAMSIAQSNRAVAKQLNGVASLYNSVTDPILAVCGIKG